MKQLITYTPIVLFVAFLASCTECEPPLLLQGNQFTRESECDTEEPSDSTSASGIYFDLSDTVMDEEVEEVFFEAEGWGEQSMNVDI